MQRHFAGRDSSTCLRLFAFASDDGALIFPLSAFPRIRQLHVVLSNRLTSPGLGRAFSVLWLRPWGSRPEIVDQKGARIMSHGLTGVRACLLVGVAVLGFTRDARSGDPLDDRLGVRSAPIFLLTRADVQRDLALQDSQVAEIQHEASELYRKARALKGNKASGVVAARRVIDDESSQWLAAHLTPRQRERLAQIELQWEGAGAMLSRPLVTEYLNLNPDQQNKVAGCISEARAQRPQGPWDYDGHVALTRKVISLLPEKQADLWIKLLGPPCKFSIDAKPQTPPARTAGGARASAPNPTR
jgi:hypothetical protein